MRRHGTPSMYRAGCRCEDCRAAAAQYARERRARVLSAEETALARLLDELAPLGPTDECPARRNRMAGDYIAERAA